MTHPGDAEVIHALLNGFLFTAGLAAGGFAIFALYFMFYNIIKAILKNVRHH